MYISHVIKVPELQQQKKRAICGFAIKSFIVNFILALFLYFLYIFDSKFMVLIRSIQFRWIIYSLFYAENCLKDFLRQLKFSINFKI
jgi:hypothetical protein